MGKHGAVLQILDVRVNPSRKIQTPWNKGDGTYSIPFLLCLKIFWGKSSAEGKKGMFTGFCFQLLDHGKQAVKRKMSLNTCIFFICLLMK